MIYHLTGWRRIFIVDSIHFDCHDNGDHWVITQCGHWKWAR